MKTLFVRIAAVVAGLCLNLACAAGPQHDALPVAFFRLPLQHAIKTVHGNGARKIVVFSDPDCPYCMLLERDTLNNMDNITIYTFLFPLDRHSDAARKAGLIWCAADRARAWRDWTTAGLLPVPELCLPPLKANLALGQRLGVRATPTLLLPQGEMIMGAIDQATLESKLGN